MLARRVWILNMLTLEVRPKPRQCPVQRDLDRVRLDSDDPRDLPRGQVCAVPERDQVLGTRVEAGNGGRDGQTLHGFALEVLRGRRLGHRCTCGRCILRNFPRYVPSASSTAAVL